MPGCYLLLGAGFSKNWGGWLAEEAFGYLLDTRPVRNEPSLRDLLWEQRKSGGFESVLSHLQWQAGRQESADAARLLKALQAAVSEMFADMNTVFSGNINFNVNNDVGDRLADFLIQFDAIFSLNQDVLLERHYIFPNDVVGLESGRGRRRPTMPGVPRIDFQDLEVTAQTIGTVRVGEMPALLKPDQQAVIKLHGSAHWIDPTGNNLLVMGGGKLDRITGHALLSQYQDEFRRCIQQPNAKLMVVGYSFRDGHINQAIERAIETGLRMFIVDPRGVEVLRSDADMMFGTDGDLFPRIKNARAAVAGESKRSLVDTFRPDPLEQIKLKRFIKG